MEITQKSAKEIVRDLHSFEQDLKKSFNGDYYTSKYLLYLKRNLLNLTLDKKDAKYYKLVLLNQAKNPVINVRSDYHTRMFIHFLLEISNSIDLNGLVQTDRLAYDLFNELFESF